MFYLYLVYVHAKKTYLPTVLSNEGGYAWAAIPGDTRIGYARVRSYGADFHPAEAGDIVKSFTFPSGGTVTVESVAARAQDWTPEQGSPSSFAGYLEDQLVYPTTGEYETRQINKNVKEEE